MQASGYTRGLAGGETFAFCYVSVAVSHHGLHGHSSFLFLALRPCFRSGVGGTTSSRDAQHVMIRMNHPGWSRPLKEATRFLLVQEQQSH